MDWPHILRLPMELLLHIASYVDIEIGILHLRLTCQALAAAALDRFAEAYISDLRCFIFDPSRLLRIKAITSTPYLASKISTLTFTICAFERESWEVPLPPKQGQELELAQAENFDYYNKQEFHKHKRPLSFRHSMGWGLIRSIMGNMRHHHKCCVALDTRSELITGSMYFQMREYSQSFAEELFLVSFETGRGIQELYLSDRVHLYPAKYETGSKLLSVLQNVKAFSYRVRPTSRPHDAGQNVQYRTHFEALRLMLNNLTNIKELGWSAPWQPWLESCENATGTSPDVLLAVDKMPSLERLCLRDVVLSSQQLLNMLQACRATLTSLGLQIIELENDGDVWTKVFRYLRTMPRLKEIYIGQAYMPDPGDEDLLILRYLLPDDPSFTRYSGRWDETPTMDYRPSQPFLDWNLEHGLIYEVEKFGS